MKTDDRDEHLGSILDDAVRGIDAFSREAPAGQRRVVGRAGLVIAAGAAAAVFVGAVVLASAQFGRDSRPGADGSNTVDEGTLESDGGVRWIEEQLSFRGYPVGGNETVRVEFSRPQDWRTQAQTRPVVIDAPNPIVVLTSPHADEHAQRACGPITFVLPSSAPRISSTGVAIAISDASESWSYPKLGSRWAALEPDSATTDEIIECRGGGTFRWLQWAFAIDRRPILVDVLMGTAVQDDVAALTWTTLDSLRFPQTPASDEPAELPPPVRDDYRSQFVSDERGYRFLPRSGRAERGVVYRFEVPHCGLDWLVDFDGSFWEGTAIVDGTNWVPAEDIPDGDAGTIELTGANWARYEASDGTWTLLSRVDGPIVRQLCD